MRKQGSGRRGGGMKSDEGKGFGTCIYPKRASRLLFICIVLLVTQSEYIYIYIYIHLS